MKLEEVRTETLLYAKYRYEHCDGDCESCPCSSIEYRCRTMYDEIKKELEKRN